MALNTISPFTSDAQAYREGLIATLLYNNNISKKADAKSVTDLFPYLNTETPEWLEDDRVKEAKHILASIQCHSMDKDKYLMNYKFICSKIEEEIDMELSKDRPDRYVITKLKQIIGEEDDRK